jgi:hypothetical protein
VSTDNQHQPEMQVPGVRYVKRKVYDVEATTLDGETTYRDVERTVRVPAPPRDWDIILVRGLISGALLVTALSLVWSTNSIGGLLDRSASALAAYSVAIIFDVVWLSCQAREWLDRRDPDRAAVPRRFGYVALAATMAAIVVHGHVEQELASGIVGAAVSGLAKAMWINVLGYYAVPLDPGMAHHLLTRRRRIAVKLAIGADRRQLQAMEAYERMLYGQAPEDVQVARMETTASPAALAVPRTSSPASLSYGTATPAAPVPAPAAPAEFPVSPQAAPVPPPPVPPVSAPAGDTSPAAGTGVWAEFNGHTFLVGPEDTPPSGFQTPEEAARERVLKSLGLPLDHPADVPASTSAEPAPPSRPHLQTVNGQTTKTGFIAAVVKADPAITLDTLTDLVREAFGDKKDLRKDVRRLRSRIEGKAS